MLVTDMDHATIARMIHAHPGADVRVIIEDSQFDVHSQVLAVYSGYFRALFDGPWKKEAIKAEGDGSLHLVKPGDIITVQQFQILLNFIYLPTFGDQVVLCESNLVDAEIVASAMDVVALQLAIQRTYGTLTKFVTWQNVEMLLETSKIKQLPVTSAHCWKFLARDKGAHWIRVWYLAERYGKDELTDPAYFSNLPRDPWNDPFFAKLSEKLQKTLLLARLREYELSSEADQNNAYGGEPVMLVNAPAALRSGSIAATTVNAAVAWALEYILTNRT
ncbi:hypothetical protein HDU87_002769 [Geranomyces variabilis]|uniref:BTB domain-containing protein n=1 Tax=Geranomyces variabilis TaxID=109894 RepID=A0AAD5TN56_9FUNG|nr:hypothetical protein HDU87_002769 [Geranomyces variabilis]